MSVNVSLKYVDFMFSGPRGPGAIILATPFHIQP
jgi:hypothetical protein